MSTTGLNSSANAPATPHEIAQRARAAQQQLLAADAARRTAALGELDALLEERAGAIAAANAADLEAAQAEGLAGVLVKRLGLDGAKLDVLRVGVRQLASSPDPVGEVITRTELDTGLVLEKVKSPIGVLLVIFESRPDAVVQIGSLALRSGNAVILKGGREAARSVEALVGVLREALGRAGLPPDAVQGAADRAAVQGLLAEHALIDLVIPRGSGELVTSIQESTRIPVLGHAEGVCHLYLDAAADPAMATELAVDGKCDYPAACNATECLLVHAAFLPRFAPVAEALRARGVTLRADGRARTFVPWAEAATEADWGREYGDLVLAVRTVGSLDEAVEFIHEHGSAHTDAIVTGDEETARQFLARVDAASVFWNASTRFADGFRYGLGAEVGISTGRVHARGPVGVEGLLTTRWLLRGHGQTVAPYGRGERHFTHKPLAP